jgi:hypothetical protein
MKELEGVPARFEAVYPDHAGIVHDVPALRGYYFFMFIHEFQMDLSLVVPQIADLDAQRKLSETQQGHDAGDQGKRYLMQHRFSFFVNLAVSYFVYHGK